MKKYGIYFLFLFLFLFCYIGFDLFISLVIKRDNHLETRIISEFDYDNLKREYDALLKKVSLDNVLEQDVIISKVILHDPYVFFDIVTIMKGQDENIEVGDIVYDEKGFIGEVTATNKHSSQVRLITNKNIQLSVRINDSYGILKRNGGYLIVENITSKEEIKKDDIVYTSIFSSIGLELPVAKVLEVFNNGIEQQLTIEALTDINQLNYVFVRKKNSYE